MKSRKIRRGEIYYANLSPIIGSEQGDSRPVLIVSNNMGNKYGPTVVITPITGNLKKTSLPTHVIIPLSSGIVTDSLVLVEQIRTIDRSRLGGYIGRIGSDVQSEIDDALAICVGITGCKNSTAKGEILTLCLCHHCEDSFKNSGYVVIKKGWQDSKEDCDFCASRIYFWHLWGGKIVLIFAGQARSVFIIHKHAKKAKCDYEYSYQPDTARRIVVAYDYIAMKEVDIRTVDPMTLEDIRNVNIDPNLPFIEKAAAYLDQIKNAYCFKCGDVIVKISHADTEATIDDCMEGFYRSL